MSAKTKTFMMFDGKIPVTVVVGKTGDWFEAGPSCPPYEEIKIEGYYAGGAFVSKPEKGTSQYRIPHVIFNISNIGKNGIEEETILHECFHLFFMIVHVTHQHPRKMRDIAHDEIYARSFTFLVDSVKKTATELLEEYKEEERKKKEELKKLLSEAATNTKET